MGWSRDSLRAQEARLRDLLREMIGSIREGRFFLTDQVADVVGVTLPEAALSKLMEIKEADPHWQKLALLLEEENTEDE